MIDRFKKTGLLLLSTSLIISSWTLFNKAIPQILIIGDSTVKNEKTDLCGWGQCLNLFFDTTKISIQNYARGGRSSRTFQTEGLWDSVLVKIQPGDFVLMQFGHNDGGSLNADRARGTLKGTGEDSTEVIMEATGKKEIIHTYGWYMRKYIRETKAKGAFPIVLSPVPRNIWQNGKVVRESFSYGKWASEVAKQEGAWFIDLNEITATQYEAMGPDSVKSKFFPGDHTHTSLAGAQLNAASIIEGLRSLKDCPLVKYLNN
jgi:lysophospholipase L1-like esterase